MNLCRGYNSVMWNWSDEHDSRGLSGRLLSIQPDELRLVYATNPRTMESGSLHALDDYMTKRMSSALRTCADRVLRDVQM